MKSTDSLLISWRDWLARAALCLFIVVSTLSICLSGQARAEDMEPRLNPATHTILQIKDGQLDLDDLTHLILPSSTITDPNDFNWPSPPVLDGAVSAAEYSNNSYTSGSTTWYMTWDNDLLYVAIAGGFNAANDALNLYIDHNPIVPVNGGGDESGSLIGPYYDQIKALFPFRGDFFAFVKEGYDNFLVADGHGEWTGGGSIEKWSAGNVTEIRIPWSTITGAGRPAAFNWFGYISYDNSGYNGVFGEVPLENPSPTGTSALVEMQAVRYFTVSDTGDGTSTNPFSQNSFTHLGDDINNFGAISVYDFTMNTPGTTITRVDEDNIWNIGHDLGVYNGQISFGVSTGNLNVGNTLMVDSGGVMILTADPVGMVLSMVDLTINGTLELSTIDVTLNMIPGPGTLSMAGSIITHGGEIHLEGNFSLIVTGTWNPSVLIDSGAVTIPDMTSSTFYGNMTVASGADITGEMNAYLYFNGTGRTVTNNGEISVSNFYFNGSGHQYLAGSGTWLNMTLGDTNLPVVHPAGGMTISANSLRVNSTLDLGGGDLTMNMLDENGSVEVPVGGIVTSSGGTVHVQGSFGLEVAGNWSPPLWLNSGTMSVWSNSTLNGSVTLAAGTLFIAESTSLYLNGDLTISSGATLAGDMDSRLYINGSGRTVTNSGDVSVTSFYFNGTGHQYLAGSGTWLNLTLGDINLPVVHPATGMTLNTQYLWVYSTLALGGGDLTVNMLGDSGDLCVPVGGEVTSSGGTVHVQGTFELKVEGTWSAPLWVNSGTVSVATTSAVDGNFTLAAGKLTISSSSSPDLDSDGILAINTSLYLNGNVTIASGAMLAGEDTASLYFNGTGTTVTNHGTVSVPMAYFDSSGDQYLAGSGTWLNVTLGEINNLVVHPAAGMILRTDSLDVSTGTLALGSGDLAINLLTDHSSLDVYPDGNVTASGGTVHLQGVFVLSVSGTWSAPFMLDSGTATVSADSALKGSVTLTAGTLNIPEFINLDLYGNLTVAGGATLAGSTNACLHFYGDGISVTNYGTVTVPLVYFDGTGDQHLAGSGTWWDMAIGDLNQPVVYLAEGMTLNTMYLIVNSTLIGGSSDFTLNILDKYGYFYVQTGGNFSSTGGTAHVQGEFEIRVWDKFTPNLSIDSGTVSVLYPINHVLGGDVTVSLGAKLYIDGGAILDVVGTLTNNGAISQMKTVNLDNTVFLNISTDRYYGLEIDPTGSTGMGYTTVTVWGNQLCQNATYAVKRCFDIVPTTSQTADVKFYFTEAERNGEVLDGLKVYHWQSEDWYQEPGVVTRGGSGNAQWVKVTGVSSYSPFMLGGSNPTAVELLWFEATGAQKVISLGWETANEIHNLGFNLYRASSPDGERVKINDSLIPSRKPGSNLGYSYEYLDTHVADGITYFYWLEELEINAKTYLYGPVSAQLAPPDEWQIYLPAVLSRLSETH